MNILLKKAVYKLLVSEDTRAVKEGALRFLREN